jgi:hypothetical protein
MHRVGCFTGRGWTIGTLRLLKETHFTESLGRPPKNPLTVAIATSPEPAQPAKKKRRRLHPRSTRGPDLVRVGPRDGRLLKAVRDCLFGAYLTVLYVSCLMES